MPRNDTRVFTRIPIDLIAQIKIIGDDGHEEPIEGRMTNMSEGGAFFETITELATGTKLVLSFAIPGGEHFSMPAQVCRYRHTDPAGIGLQFQHLEASQRLAISRMVDEHRNKEQVKADKPKDINYFLGEEGCIMKRVIGNDGKAVYYQRNSTGEFCPLDDDAEEVLSAIKLLRLIEAGDVDAIQRMGYKIQRDNDTQ